LLGRVPITTAPPAAPGQPRRERARKGGRWHSHSRAALVAAAAGGVVAITASIIVGQVGHPLVTAVATPTPTAIMSAAPTPPPAHGVVVPVPTRAACRWAYPERASGKTAGAGYSIVCLGRAGQVLGGFSGSHSLAAWCADPGHTGGQNLPQPALIGGAWRCTSGQHGQILGQRTLVLKGNGTGYDLDAVNTGFAPLYQRSWTVQNIEYFPHGIGGNPSIAIAGSPYTDVTMGKNGPWTYEDCLEAPYGDNASAPGPNVITGSSLRAGEGICVETQNAATKHDGNHIVLLIIGSVTSAAVTVQVTVWS
jgi:hypothetical protein